MPLRDSYANPITTNSDTARDAYDEGVHVFLSDNVGAEALFARAVQADPGFALAHVGVARACLSENRTEDARAAFARAEALADAADDREKGHIRAVGLALAGRAAEARAAVKAHVRDFPRDALIAQMCTSVFGLIGFSGEVAHEADLLAYTSALMPHYGDDWWMMSMHAISLCETGQVDASMRLMERSLARNPRNANAAHFKSHALYESGETATGRAYLDAWMRDYDRAAKMHGHLTWHLALWALHAGDEAAMWAAIDGGVGPGASRGLPINILTDTAAILHRAEIAGVQVDPARWKRLSDYAVQYFPDPGQSFVDVHAALSHAMAGEGERLARIADDADGFAGDIARPMARAWAAIARQDWAGALEELGRVVPGQDRFGGSRAQRDLIELAYVNVLMKLGHRDEARRTLAMRRPVLAPDAPVAGWH